MHRQVPIRARVLTALIASTAAALVVAPSALANANRSANWSGYAAHRSGVNFSRVTASWIQPHAACVQGHRSYSAFWVGIGGYNRASTALEQIGTEVDCAATGTVKSTAWFELVPAATRPIHLVVNPGDSIDASVEVNGSRVTLTLHDATTGRAFHKTLNAFLIDTSSAEWIAEAPSVCAGDTACQTLPLADFGSARFTSASAATSTGHIGSISDRTWRRTKISLLPRRGELLTAAQETNSAGAARPSGLARRGSSFTVHYSQLSRGRGQSVAAQRLTVQDARLVHAGLQ